MVSKWLKNYHCVFCKKRLKLSQCTITIKAEYIHNKKECLLKAVDLLSAKDYVYQSLETLKKYYDYYNYRKFYLGGEGIEKFKKI